jgi:hypothetical protein
MAVSFLRGPANMSRLCRIFGIAAPQNVDSPKDALFFVTRPALGQHVYQVARIVSSCDWHLHHAPPFCARAATFRPHGSQ